VDLIGRGGKFVHYRCRTCAEVWTGMKFPPPAPNPAFERLDALKDRRR
jgi:hypothetical protein